MRALPAVDVSINAVVIWLGLANRGSGMNDLLIVPKYSSEISI